MERSALLAAPGLEGGLGSPADELLVVFPADDLPPALRAHSFCAVRFNGDALMITLCAPDDVNTPVIEQVVPVDHALPGDLMRQVDAVLLRASDRVKTQLADADRFWVCAVDVDGQVTQAQCFGYSEPGKPALPCKVAEPHRWAHAIVA